MLRSSVWLYLQIFHQCWLLIAPLSSSRAYTCIYDILFLFSDDEGVWVFHLVTGWRYAWASRFAMNITDPSVAGEAVDLLLCCFSGALASSIGYFFCPSEESQSARISGIDVAICLVVSTMMITSDVTRTRLLAFVSIMAFLLTTPWS